VSKPVPPKKKSVPEKVAPATRRPSIEVEEMPNEDDTTSSEWPHNPRNILEAADGSDNDVGSALPKVISVGSGTDEEDSSKMVEDNEDEEAELDLYLLWITLLAVDFVPERMSKKWTSPVYVFFKNTPNIQYKEGHRCHVFKCTATQCKGRNTHDVCQFLDKGDANSTSNLLRHAKKCWGEETVEAATATLDLDAARKVLKKMKLKNEDITTEFKRIGKRKVTYCHTNHTTTEARYVPSIFALPVPTSYI
jgi:hypothetical protein